MYRKTLFEFRKIRFIMGKIQKSMNSFQLKHLKYKEQRQGKVDAPSKIEIHVVASGSYGTSPSIYIDTDYVK